MDTINEVRMHYDGGVQGEYCKEWERLDEHRIEFEITKRYIGRYVKPGDKVLDLGGGPGRYAMHLVQQGCDVTLADLSDEHVAFAKRKASQLGVSISAFQADAREIDKFTAHHYDHILLMGPMYHLQDEADRALVVEKCLKLLKPGGTLFVSFISSYAGNLYLMAEAPHLIFDENEQDYIQCFINDKDYSGPAFTQAFFAKRDNILTFFDCFPLEKLHFLSQEGMLAPNEHNIMSQPEHIIDKWIDLAEQVCEREDLLSYAEHFLYIGKHIGS